MLHIYDFSLGVHFYNLPHMEGHQQLCYDSSDLTKAKKLQFFGKCYQNKLIKVSLNITSGCFKAAYL
jgi:hypothetical protein